MSPTGKRSARLRAARRRLLWSTPLFAIACSSGPLSVGDDNEGSIAEDSGDAEDVGDAAYVVEEDVTRLDASDVSAESPPSDAYEDSRTEDVADTGREMEVGGDEPPTAQALLDLVNAGCDSVS